MAIANSNLSSIYVPLRLAYGLVPIVAGADKFFNLLTYWPKYLPDQIASVLPISPDKFMLIVGVIEIVAGLAVLTKFTRLGAYVVMVWLLAIAANLVIGRFYDVAVRDAVMAIGAYTLGQVAALRGEGWFPGIVTHERISSHAATR
jgi:uncharacterized membrane protein YphA (DoxX/SURF4 family)